MKTKIVSNPTPQICEYCGAKYIPGKRGVQRYCSSSCRSVAYKKPLEEKSKKQGSGARAVSESEFKKLEKRVKELESELAELSSFVAEIKWKNNLKP